MEGKRMGIEARKNKGKWGGWAWESEYEFHHVLNPTVCNTKNTYLASQKI